MGPVDRAVVERAVRVCDGNPFFVLALAGGAGAADSVRTLVRQQLAGLAPDAIEAIAVIGRDALVSELRAMTGRELGPLLEDLAAAERAGAVKALDAIGARYGFVHDLVRETIYDDLPLPRRVALHARALAALDERTGCGASEARAGCCRWR